MVLAVDDFVFASTVATFDVVVVVGAAVAALSLLFVVDAFAADVSVFTVFKSEDTLVARGLILSVEAAPFCQLELAPGIIPDGPLLAGIF